MFIFPLIFLASFFTAIRSLYYGKTDGALTFFIFGLSLYTTAMSVSFVLGLRDIIPIMQTFKELLVFGVLILNIAALKHRPRFHLIDYLILAFLGYVLLYAFLPIGTNSVTQKLVAFKSNCFYFVVYFAARFIDPKLVYVNKYFNYMVLLTIAAGAVVCVEVMMHAQLQLFTGYAEYNYYFFNIEPGGLFGLSTTFDSEGGYRRFASFFANPLEHAGATLVALSMIIALYTRDDNKFKITNVGALAVCASVVSIIFAFSRAPFVSYFVVIYIYALVTRKKYIVNSVHLSALAAALYLGYLFTQYDSRRNGIIEVIMNTLDFSNPSSVGHVIQWVEGVLAIINHPLGLGLGTSGRVGGSLGSNTGGENQFIIIGVQTGVIALFLYLVIYAMFIKTSKKWLSKLKGKERKVCMAVFLIKIAFFIPMLTSEVESSTYLSYMDWFLSGLFISMIMQPAAPQLQTANDN